VLQYSMFLFSSSRLFVVCGPGLLTIIVVGLGFEVGIVEGRGVRVGAWGCV